MMYLTKREKRYNQEIFRVIGGSPRCNRKIQRREMSRLNNRK